MLARGASDTEQPGAFLETARKLRAAARNGGVVQAAQVRYVNLPEIKARAGPHWPLVQTRLTEGSLRTMRDLLENDDVVIPCGDGFLLVFAHGVGDELTQRGERIEEALTSYYVGEEGLELLRARAKQCALDVKQAHALADQPPAIEHAAQAPAAALYPVWSIAAETVICHFVVPTFCEHGAVRVGYNSEFRETGVSRTGGWLSLDLLLLKAASQQLETMHAIENAGVIGVSVHATTLRNPVACRAYAGALSLLRQDLRKRFVIKVAEIERGTALNELCAWTLLLKKYARQVALEFHANDRAPEGLGKAGAWAAGYQLPPYRPDAAADALAPVQGIVRYWRGVLTRAQMRFFVDNVRSASLLTALAADGVDFATSNLFWPPLVDLQSAPPTPRVIAP